jgi:muconolactone delta-isomerase
MHACITYDPRSPAPPEMLPMMIEGTSQWQDRYGGKFEALYWYVAGGGIGIIEIDDEAELAKMIAEHPFTPYSDVNIRPCVDAQTGLNTYREALQQQLAAVQPGNGAPAAA